MIRPLSEKDYNIAIDIVNTELEKDIFKLGLNHFC